MLFSPFALGTVPPIDTPRLLIRAMRMTDVPDLFAYSKDPEVSRHVLWDAHQSPSETKAYVKHIQRKYRAGDPSSWVLELKATGRVIGTIGFMWINREYRSTEVGYSLARAYWGQGLMTEALTAFIRYGFKEEHLHRIEAQHEVDNPASGRVMEKAGMQKEGILRARLYNKGKFVDVALYAILREDTLAK